MTRVDFYIGTSADPGGGAAARLNIACRLAEKAYRMGHQVHVHAASPEQAAQLDDLLWTFKQGSFVPHGRAGRPEAARAAVLIDHQDQPPSAHEVLINLADTVPGYFSRFERVAEIVSGDEDGRAQARERYRFYRDRGYELETHEISA